MAKRCMGCMEVYGEVFEVCPHCGYVDGTPAEEAVHMQPGTLLYDRYIIGRVLGFGGFGVTYIGWDGKLEQKVAIKEYLPSEFSTRMPGQSGVTVFGGNKYEQFHDGMEKFVDEAKRLAKFQNEPGIVKIFDSFTENDTAYIVMEYLDGETLTQRLAREKTIPESEAVAMLWPVMNSLQAVHAEGILHRDIAPDNIFLTKDGEVKLIDFGASRYATTSHSRSLTVIIKPGYSPEEQYRSRGDQGPHTDVYALAATLYKMITGKTPPDAMERRAKVELRKKEILEEPHKLCKNVSINRENAILNAMNVRVEDRTPDVLSFMQELNADPPVKRRYGKIKKLDLYAWPLWLKIALPAVLATVLSLGVLMLTGVIRFDSLFSDDVVVPEGIVVVPDVEGMEKDAAIALLTEQLLFASPEGNVESPYIAAGKIVLQTPMGGSYLEEHGTVVLTVSSGAGVVGVKDGIATVPYVIWDTEEDALTKLRQAGLGTPQIERKSDENVAAGQIISQSVEAGTEVDEGTVITLTVSTGPAAFKMPGVTGQAEAKAKQTLASRGLAVTITYEKSTTVAEGAVIRQSVAAGTSVKRGDKVTLTVSSGKPMVTVANVTGKTRAAATSTLQGQGFTVTVLENYDNSVAAGNVIRQSPSGGTSQIKGSTVVIYVSKGAYPISGWVLESAVPSGARVVEEKWTYDLTTNITSDRSVESGYTLYKTTSGWSSYGAWSSWSTTAVSESDSRQVETKTVTDKAGYTNYRYWIYRSSDGYSYGTKNYTPSNGKKCTIYDEINLTYALPLYNSSLGTYGPYDSSMFSHSYDKYWFFGESKWVQAVTHTEYRYRERSLVYTYYHTKTEAKESATKVTADSTISNVQRWVKYQMQ